MKEYDKYMDQECIGICDSINEIPNCETFESCCGHLKDCFSIFVKTSDEYALSILARSFDKRYSGTSKLWKINLDTLDVGTPKFCLYIHSDGKYVDYETMRKDTEILSKNIKYWLNKNFINYFLEK